MDETTKMETHLTSAAAFVEGGIQDACDDSCSICLEAFCDSDPSTVTGCKHEFHLQCILEWCQRSSQCPMCWQDISLKDPTSQELLEAVERERSIRFNQSRNATIFHHPTLGDFELQHLPVGGSDSELEERIIQHLAAAAAMGRAHHMARREGQRNRSTAQGRPQFLVFSTHPNAPSVGPVSAILGQRGGENEQASVVTPEITSVPPAAGEDPSQQLTPLPPAQVEQVQPSASGDNVVVDNRPGLSHTRSANLQTSQSSQDRAGPSEFQSLSESLKSRLNSVSMRCKESISKSTRGWKERLSSVSRNASVADIGSEVRREVHATVSRMIERLEARDSRASTASASHDTDGLVTEPSNQRTAEAHGSNRPNSSNPSASCASSSGPN